MKRSYHILVFIVSLLILASCSNSEKGKEETVHNEQKTDEVTESEENVGKVETNEGLTVTNPLETVKAFFQAALDSDVDTFFELGEGYLNKSPISPPEMMETQAQIIEDHGGIENMTIEVIVEDQLTEQYANYIDKNYGSYGDEVVVVAQWSFNSGAEPKAWVVELKDTGNQIIALDVTLELGNKFTFTEEPTQEEELVEENQGGGNSVADIMRKSPYNTLSLLYKAAYENDHQIFNHIATLDEYTEISNSELMSMMRESAIEAGHPGEVRIEVIPHDMLNPELKDTLAGIYGDDFAFMVEWITEDYLNTFVLKNVDDWYYLYYAEDESKSEFMNDYVNEKYEYHFDSFGNYDF